MANEIHPTAVIDPGVELGDGVFIGPYCVLNAGVKIGDGCRLQNHVTIDGPTEIGANNEFYSFTSIGQRTQDLKYAGEPTYLKVGDGNIMCGKCALTQKFKKKKQPRINSAKSHQHIEYCPVHGFKEELRVAAPSEAEQTQRANIALRVVN